MLYEPVVRVVYSGRIPGLSSWVEFAHFDNKLK